MLLREQIPSSLGWIQLTLPAFFGVYSYRTRGDLTHNFIYESEIIFLTCETTYLFLGYSVIIQIYRCLGRNLNYFKRTLLQTFWKIFLRKKCESDLT